MIKDAYLYGLVCFALAYRIVPAQSVSLFDWARRNGAFIHECLEYRNGGMYTTCDIPTDTYLTSIPKSLSFGGDVTPIRFKGIEQLADRIMDKRTQTVFTKSLPTTCQIPSCRPIDRNQVTLFGAKKLRETNVYQISRQWSEVKRNLTSVVQSRTWTNLGMLPINELFNHDCSAMKMMTNKTHCITSSWGTAYKAGEQVFIDYGIRTRWEGYLDYGFVPKCITPTCEDARLLRTDDHEELRVACIANSTSTMRDMFAEFAEAVVTKDTGMIRGVLDWYSNPNLQTR